MILRNSSSCILLLLCSCAMSELFTAIVDLEKLLYTEGEIIKLLEQYLDTEEQRLEKVRWFQEQHKKLYRTANEDVQTFLSNPINAYLLVKRLTADWKMAENLVQGSNSRAVVENITHHRQDLKFPDDEDLSGAAAALIRLQDTYQLDTSTLARGQIRGTKSSPGLSAGDCFELGRQAYSSSDFYHTLLWMQEAMDRIDEEDDKTADKVEIMEYIAFCTYKKGNMRHALKLTNDILEISPDHQRALQNKEYFMDELVKIEAKKRGDDGDFEQSVSSDIQQENVGNTHTIPEREIYAKLCREENFQTEEEKSKLHCHYFTNDHPFLLLQPVKEEELYLSPRIVVYHKILSDKEISVIKFLAQPRLQRATVQNAHSGALEIASYRISKSAWLKDEDHDVILRINNKIESITGLTLDTAEELQVVNYGIGGHYDPHFDFARKEETNAFKSLGTGNRIATWLNYMSDVDAGGATVFPDIGISVTPEKGSAAFWYNLLTNGDGDERTRHAACPVLAGSKWVSNKWIHERGQEFRRRCGLHLTD